MLSNRPRIFSISRWYLATALLLPALSKIFELRWNRRCYRPWDNPRFRRQGTTIRQGRQHDAMVEQRDDQSIPREGTVHSRSVLAIQITGSRSLHKRPNDAGWKYRRQWWIETIVSCKYDEPPTVTLTSNCDKLCTFYLPFRHLFIYLFVYYSFIYLF